MTRSICKYKYLIPTQNIHTPESVINELRKLNSLLMKSELLQIGFFNRAYLIVTEKINRASASGLFTHPKLMDDLEVTFAKVYFDALNCYVNSGFLPGAWHKVSKKLKYPASLSLLLGADAHINHDLLGALLVTIHNPREFSEDYFKVNQLLLESRQAISASYYESQVHINFLKKALRALYLRPVMGLILRWRRTVWENLSDATR